MPITLEQCKLLKPGDKLRVVNNYSWNMSDRFPLGSILTLKKAPEILTDFAETMLTFEIKKDQADTFYAYRFELVEPVTGVLRELYRAGKLNLPCTVRTLLYSGCYAIYEVLSYNVTDQKFEVYSLYNKGLENFAGTDFIEVLPGE